MGMGYSTKHTEKHCAVVAVVLLLLCSCASKKNVEYSSLDVVKYDTRILHDTITNNVHDSVFHTIYQVGDTIYNTKYVQRVQYKDRVVVSVDTCYMDSVQTVSKEKVVEKKTVPKWCYLSLVVTLLLFILILLKVKI